MAQPARAKVKFNVRVTIDKDGNPNIKNADIPNGGGIRFKSGSTKDWVLTFTEADGSGIPFQVMVEGNEHVTLIADVVNTTLDYTINPFSGILPPGKAKGMMPQGGPYTIKIGSGDGK